MKNHMGTSEDRRQRTPGIFFTRAQFVAWALVIFSSVTTAQLAINYYAFRAWVHEEAVTQVREHNKDTTAHPASLLASAEEKTEIVKQLVALQTKLDGIERMLTVIASQGKFNIENQNRRGIGTER